MKKDVVAVTHGNIMKQIIFFKGKPQLFVMKMISKMSMSTNLANDVLFSQGDSCDEIFFIYKGKVVMYIDISDHINMQHFVSLDKAFNLPLTIYNAGTYFGDNDVLLLKNGYRVHTAICKEDCLIYTLKHSFLKNILEDFPKMENLMYKIANEKNKYYDVLISELKNKYSHKSRQEVLINNFINVEWTCYMSIKRAMIKRTA